MLRISKKADYAVFLLGAIARQGAFPGGSAQDSVVSAHEIAKQAGLNKSVVANLLKEFSRHGLLDSVRGLRGGYRLAHPPGDISLGQILEVVEGKFVLVDCVPHESVSFLKEPAKGATQETSPHDCSLISFCPSKQPMRVVHQRINALFAEICLDELCSMNQVNQEAGNLQTGKLQTGKLQTGNLQTGNLQTACATNPSPTADGKN